MDTDDIEEEIMGTAPVPAPQSTDYYSFGCTLLDLLVGGGTGMGVPGGYMINLVGDKSAGKTLISMEMLAANYHRWKKTGFKWNVDDAESGNTFDTRGTYGVNLVPEDARKSNTVQEMDANVGTWLGELKKRDRGIYVVDSLDGLSDNESEAAAEAREKLLAEGKEVVDKGSYAMGTAAFLSKSFFKVRTGQLAEKNAVLVIVSQVRENLDAGLYVKKFKRSGGKAMDFYAHTCLWLSTIKKIEKNGLAIGVVVEAKAEKSKTPRPFRSCRFSILFGYGIDEIGSNLDYLFNLRGKDGELVNAAKAIAWSGKEKSLKNLVGFLQQNGLDKAAREAKKKDDGKPQLSVEWLLDWIPQQDSLAAAYRSEFGDGTVDRETLIQQIDNDPAMRVELKQRVIAKWEALEAAVAVQRKGKYT